jgi:hypothetical protein
MSKMAQAVIGITLLAVVPCLFLTLVILYHMKHYG